MKMKSVLAAGLLSAIVGGCQTHHRTPGEEIIQSAPRGEHGTGVAMAPAPATTMAATAPVVTPAVAVAPVAVATPVPVTMPVTTPATTPASTAPADRGPQLYVAADADEATRFRNWRPVVNQYLNGDVIAGPVYRITAPPPRSDRWDDVYAVDLFETALSVPQMFATPFWMLFTPPWTPVEYHGEQYPPSYTVDDPFPYYVNERVPGTVQMKRDK